MEDRDSKTADCCSLAEMQLFDDDLAFDCALVASRTSLGASTKPYPAERHCRCALSMEQARIQQAISVLKSEGKWQSAQ